MKLIEAALNWYANEAEWDEGRPGVWIDDDKRCGRCGYYGCNAQFVADHGERARQALEQAVLAGEVALSAPAEPIEVVALRWYADENNYREGAPGWPGGHVPTCHRIGDVYHNDCIENGCTDSWTLDEGFQAQTIMNPRVRIGG